MNSFDCNTHTASTQCNTSPYHTVPKDGRLSLLKDGYGKPHYSAEGFNLNYLENI